LWWAFKPDQAEAMGSRASELGGHEAGQKGDRAVILVDEIDKADPDLPNNLLVPIGEWRVQGPEGPVEAADGQWPLVVITSNNERDLPNAFLRRCVILSLPRPTKDHLEDVAVAHLGERDDELYAKAATLVLDRAGAPGARAPSTAEFLDFVRACIELELEPDTDEWRRVEQATLAKEPEPEGRRVG
jgi:MoxR-like ATPase